MRLRRSVPLASAGRPSASGVPALGAGRTYRILAPKRYPWRFNGPRRSRHCIENRSFAPFNYVHQAVEGVTVFNPWPPRRFDLVHAFNRIPIGRTPFVIGFESHLPRAFGWERTPIFRAQSALLDSARCRGIVAISQHAADLFRRQHGLRFGETVLRKLTIRYPNIEVAPLADAEDAAVRQGSLEVVFVGNHFARKGGCVVALAARRALAARLPVIFHIVSRLEVGGAIWTDPHDPAFFNTYFECLNLPNVRWSQALPNAAVQALLGRADLHILPTLGDTFGFSVVEAMARGTPVIATAQGALPEVIVDGRNGFLLPLQTNSVREWIHLGAPDRSSRAFQDVFTDTVTHLAECVTTILSRLADTRNQLPGLRRAAHADAIRLFDAAAASRWWDSYYEGAIAYGA